MLENVMASRAITPIHLVLAGGGIKSLSFAGTLDVLANHGIEFLSVSACSAGTFVGALLCCGLKPAEIVERILKLPSWIALEGKRASSIPDFVYGLVPGLLFFHPMLQWPFARYRESGFSEVFKSILGCDPKFRELDLPLAIAAFDITAQRYLVYAKYTHPEMTVSEALSIAVSIPFAYPPKLRKGRILLDAGLASECPVWLAADQSYDPIIALRPKRVLTQQPETVDQFFMETMGSVVRGLDDYIISKMPRVRLIEIDCGNIRVDQFDMTGNEKNQLIEAGRKAGNAALERYGEGFKIPGQLKEPFFNDTHDDYAEHDNKAMKHGTELMTRFHQNMSKDMPTHVFISYAHQDKGLADCIVHDLSKSLEPNAIWYDKRIELGDKWEQEIMEKMMESKVAILLVSNSFLSSKFISGREVPILKDLHNKKGMKIIPIIIRECEWKEVDYIEEKQILCVDQPFESLTDERRKVEIGKLADVINSILLDDG